MSTDLVKKDFMNSVEELFNKFSNEISELKDKIDKLERVNSEKDIEIKKLNEEIIVATEKLKEINKENKDLRLQSKSLQMQYDESVKIIDSCHKNKRYNQLYYGVYLLIISLVNEDIDRIIDTLKMISSSTNRNLNDNEVILNIGNLLLQKINYENKLNLYSYLDNYGIENIEDSVLRKIRELIKQNISETCVENKQNVNKVKADILEGYIEYQLISRKKLVCAIDGCNLKAKKIELALFYDKKYEEVIEWIPTQAYVCEKCNRLYLLDEQAQKLKNKVIGKGIYKQVSYNNMKLSMREYNIKNSPNIFYDKLSEDVKKELTNFSKSNNDLSKNGLKDNFEVQIMKIVAPELIKMGYSINISRQTRWSLLRDRIIPKLGLLKTKAIFFALVCYDGSIKKPKLVEQEWRYDYNKLKSK